MAEIFMQLYIYVCIPFTILVYIYTLNYKLSTQILILSISIIILYLLINPTFLYEVQNQNIISSTQGLLFWTLVKEGVITFLILIGLKRSYLVDHESIDISNKFFKIVKIVSLSIVIIVVFIIISMRLLFFFDSDFF
ncbi:hypothetical protein [Arcobacter sp. CECT 8985]|uniref:hypothetical protein n=1 Tax=Arcobacter sp. CECT 8985 TaxID=1935424 RepID=UPI00100B2523|nr:hypothetical protein [Arcobacter sp. CECT 8985]RXJ86660.1 hypothetical protein CRU93_07550 [Arcobacter sp. CECT 8985]